MLLIEDNALDLELTQRALRAANFTHSVKVLRDGAEALDYLLGNGDEGSQSERVNPKLILLDLKLPKVSGLEVLERLKADSRTRAIPVVAVTSSREESDTERAYALGANSYIVKPMEFEKFVETIAMAVSYWLLVNEPPR
ncbi:MAG: response regulator [Thermoanaerobaculia bacterium]